MSNTMRNFDRLDQITPADVQWLKGGSERRGGYIYNGRSISYITKRGTAKSMTCYVHSNGAVKWRSWTLRGNVSEGLTTEESRVFAPEIAARRDEQTAKRRGEKMAAQKAGRAVKVGDIFGDCYGYDATLWEFYEVVRVSESGKTIWTRELAHETKPGYGYNDWKCRPVPGCFAKNSKVEKHLVQYTTWDSEPRPFFKQDYCVRPELLDNPEEWHDADNYH